MESEEFPLILSPNLGCPQIVPLRDTDHRELNKTFTLIVATRYGEFTTPAQRFFSGRFLLRPSHQGYGANTGKPPRKKDLPLSIRGEPTEIKGWNVLSDFSGVDRTRELISNVLHYDVLGKGTRYWKITVFLRTNRNDDEKLLQSSKAGGKLPSLYDLVFKADRADKSHKYERVNRHAVQLIDKFKTNFSFIHLTDLHLAKRNDEILGEVLQEKQDRSREEIREGFVNFNKNFRTFIGKANELAAQGKLDFIVITGDLVDFSFHGWEYGPNADENNWRTFINIATGSDKERDAYGNEGLRMAVFTSTGNHDWRSYPYQPRWFGLNKSFGLSERELAYYEYETLTPDQFEALRKEGAPTLSEVDASFRVPGALKLAERFFKWFLKWYLTLFGVILAGLAIFFIYRFAEPMTKILAIMAGLKDAPREGIELPNVIPPLLSALVLFILQSERAKKICRDLFHLYGGWVKDWLLSYAIDFGLSIYASPMSLHYYFKHVNPFLDYAFAYGGHAFIVMDTGADLLTGKLLEEKKVKPKTKPLSLADNTIGGSPDSMGFDSRKTYCDYSQIDWLDRVLTAVRSKSVTRNKDGDVGMEKRTFLFLHSPPFNPPTDNFAWWPEHLETPTNPWVDQTETDLGFGTLNHYVSQLLFLCMGYRENELAQPAPLATLREPALQSLKDLGLDIWEFLVGLWRFLVGIWDFFFASSPEKSGKLVHDLKSVWETIRHVSDLFRRDFFVRGPEDRDMEPGANGDPERPKEVDIVFSGHAHRNIEFRLHKDEKNRIRVATEIYSLRLLPPEPLVDRLKSRGRRPSSGWDGAYAEEIVDEVMRKFPWEPPLPPGSVLVQTAAGGLKGDTDLEPPYFQRVVIGDQGQVKAYHALHLVKVPGSKQYQVKAVTREELLGT